MERSAAKRQFSWFLNFALAAAIVSAQAASAALPPCLDKGVPLPIDNAQVLRWKETTANQFLARARVQGPIVRIYPDRNSHNHFVIQLGPRLKDTLEVVYNKSFGALPKLSHGMNIEACGDYITSIAQSGHYAPSPDGAIIHWVHKNPKGRGHESGYVAVDGKLFGYGSGGDHGFIPMVEAFGAFDFFDEELDEAFAQ